MKTRSLVLTAFALIIATAVSATKIPTLNLIPMENHKALMAFAATKPCKLEVSLKNRFGETVYNKKSENAVDNFKVIFIFTELKDGDYNLSVEMNNCNISRDFKLSHHTITEVGEVNKVFDPYFNFEDNLLKISYLNCNQNNILLNIYHKGQHVAGKKLGKEMCIQKAIDLSKLEKGEYAVVLGDKNNYYHYVINK